jgi:hypothetical protein
MSGGQRTNDIRLTDGSPPQSIPAARNLRSPADRPGIAEPALDPWFDSSADGYASFGDADTPAEVDAVFRLQRRIAVAHFVTFMFVTLGVSVAIVTLDWAASSRVFGGFSPGFVLAAIGLYFFFVIVAVAAASLANSIEDRMMGAGSLPSEPPRS